MRLLAVIRIRGEKPALWRWKPRGLEFYPGVPRQVVAMDLVAANDSEAP